MKIFAEAHQRTIITRPNFHSSIESKFARYRFDNGVLAQLHDAFTVKYGGNGIEVHGEAGSIVGRNVMTQRGVGELLLRNADGEQAVAVDHVNLYERGVAAFCAAMRGVGQPAATAEDGIRSLNAALAVVQACRTGVATQIVDPV